MGRRGGPILVLILGLILVGGCVFYEVSEISPGPRARYYPVQLHLHGSLSEGEGSMAGHNAVARQLGTVAGLWWTDHDWRIAGHGYLDGFAFEAAEEHVPVPYRDTPWGRRQETVSIRWQDTSEAGLEAHWARLSHQAPSAGEHALELGARAQPGAPAWRWSGITLVSTGDRLRSSLAADLEVELQVRPATAWSETSRLLVDLVLSKQADGALAELIYVIGDPGEARVVTQDRRRLGIVPVAAPVGRWTRLALAPTEDARRLDLGGWDNSLHEVRIGAQVRRGGEAQLGVDALAVRRQRSGVEVLARAEQMAAELAREYGLFNHVGLEVSYGVHMNAYLPRIEMPDFGRFPHGMPPRETVLWAHRRGGVVSYNHVFGTREGQGDDYEGRARLAIENRAFGADLLEVGYPHRVLPLERHLEVWDALSAARTFLGGIGTSDSHRQSEGWRNGNNYVTWVWSDGPSTRELIAGLRSRRLFFGDPVLFPGELELETAEGVPMGQVVATRESSREVVLRLTRLPEGAEVRWIVDGTLARSLEPPAGDLVDRLRVDTTGYHFVRAEVWKRGRGLAFSNCLYFLPEGTPNPKEELR